MLKNFVNYYFVLGTQKEWNTDMKRCVQLNRISKRTAKSCESLLVTEILFLKGQIKICFSA